MRERTIIKNSFLSSPHHVLSFRFADAPNKTVHTIDFYSYSNNSFFRMARNRDLDLSFKPDL